MGNKYKHLSAEERDQIAVMRAEGESFGEIAHTLGRNKSTICREVWRNRSPVYDRYGAIQAQKRAQRRKCEAGRRPLLKHDPTRRYVICKLQLGWSPEQIAGRLPHDHPELRISHEAIYQYIYNPHVRKTRELIPLLVRSHKKRQARGHTKKHRKSHIPDRIPIDRRPAYVEKRQQPGHWESDTIISRQSKEAIGVCLERSTRFVHLAKLEKKGAADLAEAINRRLGRHPPHMRRTITYDNGSENAQHMRVNKVLGTRSYFCHPYQSWQRGAVENVIGLVRRYLPKKTDFSNVSCDHLKMIQNWINNRPRKCLDFKTPLEVFIAKRCT